MLSTKVAGELGVRYLSTMFEYLNSRFKCNGSFYLDPDQNIRDAIRINNVPNDFGVYIVSKISDLKESIIYIGKAGSINNDGSLKKQGIRKRLGNKQGGIARTEYFLNYMKRNKTSLRFEWYVTFNQDLCLLPSLVEAELIQKYYNEYKKLPELNKSF